MKVGVLALQGDFAEHIAVLKHLGVEGHEIRLPEHLEGVDGLIIPGGESTTLSRLMSISSMREPIEQMARQGKVIWGTCAGMILVAMVLTEADPVPLNIMDIGGLRNGFGRQVDSFEQDLELVDLGPTPFHGVFIRAPVITRVGREVKVMATLPDGQAVAVRQGNLLATSFHPELTGDSRFHQYFLDLIPQESSPSA
ncbi:MAG: pyridoxal 5'-phosphate synthase glutaminase subunit PdxT [Dehalococcoidia bacterium]|nr:pyridoxal 5'-phosphate synthase glutaminase subunit PdxT [Dehalococcoidia bacterium]